MRNRCIFALLLCLVVLGSRPVIAGSSRVTLEVKDAPIRDVLLMLSRQCGTSIVLGGSIEGTVTATLVDTPFEQALGIILSSTDYPYYWKDGAVIVDPLQMVNRVVRVNYVDANRIATALQSFVSEGGMIQAFNDEATDGVEGDGFANRLIIVERESRIEALIAMIGTLDAVPAQVRIEAKIIETTLGDEERLGLKWNISSELTGATVPTTFPFPKKSSGETNLSPTPDPGDKSLFLRSEFPDGEFFPFAQPDDFLFGRLSAANFSLVLDALASRRNTNLISNPKITTLDNRPAQILVGKKVPIALFERQRETGTMEVIGYDQQEIGVSLWVTPHVGEDGLILLEIAPETSDIIEFIGQFNERPVTATRSARTQVLVKDGETVVIGGLVSEVERRIDTRVPVLGSIPLLGRLFRHTSNERKKVDLLIFITPTIIKN